MLMITCFECLKNNRFLQIHRDVVIIGSGPAGCTAAIYSARAMLQPLVIAGYQAGGQLMLTSDVENFPGYQLPISGPQMMEDLTNQAQRFGALFWRTNCQSKTAIDVFALFFFLCVLYRQ